MIFKIRSLFLFWLQMSTPARKEDEVVHIPKMKQGGTFIDSKEVKLHANDFDWETKMEELTEDERFLVQQYLSMCNNSLDKKSSCAMSQEPNPRSWESHFSSTKLHFPLKNYIIHAFPVLKKMLQNPVEQTWVLEGGCGTGSTLLPLMRECASEHVHFVGFDISEAAVDHFCAHEISQSYVAKGKLHCFQLAIGSSDRSSCNGSDNDLVKRQRIEGDVELVATALKNAGVEPANQKFDVILLVFVLSALPSIEKMLLAIHQLKRVLKPNGVLLFRDYALPDHNFFRFLKKMNNVVPGIVFQKGDGTTQTFFEKEFTINLFRMAGMESSNEDESQLQYHCTRIVNRKNGKRMDKIFINGAFKIKP